MFTIAKFITFLFSDDHIVQYYIIINIIDSLHDKNKQQKRMNNLRVLDNTLDVIKENNTNKLVPRETLFVCLFPMCPFLASCQCITTPPPSVIVCVAAFLHSCH